MILQSDKYSCGAAAIINALRAVGHRMTLGAVVKLAGTTPIFGTTDRGVRRALRALEYRPVPLNVVGSAAQAVAALRGYLVTGCPVILSWDRGEHWVAAVATLGERVVIADSADTDLVRVFSPGETAARWREKSKEGRDIYCGIAVVSR